MNRQGIHASVRDILRRMTLEQKVGQMFLLAFAGADPRRAESMIRDHFIGGCYLSDDNASTPGEALSLSQELQRYALSSGARVPLLLGADQEGAWSVMMPAATTGPGNLGLGAADDTRLTREMYRVMGEELRSVGYNVVFAPCVDVNSNPRNSIIGMRSFGETPRKVARHSAAAVRGLHAAGVMATAKHFPGHGDTAVDSHRDIPHVDHTRAEVKRIDLLPYRHAIAAGVDIIMTSHILFPAFDKDSPATLSRPILGELLRTQMRFGGMVISDSMNMGAMRKHYEPGEASFLAVEAGVDMIMLAEEHYDHDQSAYEKNQLACIEGIVAGVKSGRLSEGIIDEAVSRILTLKTKYNLFSQSHADLDPGSVGNEEHRNIEREASERSVAVVRNRAKRWPLQKVGRIAVVQSAPQGAYEILTATRGIGPNQAETAFDAFSSTLGKLRPDVTVLSRAEVMDPSKSAGLANDFQAVVVVTEDYPLPGVDFDTASQKETVENLLRVLGDKLIVVALRTPYELSEYSTLATYVCTCSSRPAAAVAAARAACGLLRPHGKLPVSVK